MTEFMRGIARPGPARRVSAKTTRRRNLNTRGRVCHDPDKIAHALGGKMENGKPKTGKEILGPGGQVVRIVKPGEKPDMKGVDKIIELDAAKIMDPTGRTHQAFTLQKSARIITDEKCDGDCGVAPELMPVCKCYKNSARSMVVGAGSMSLGFSKMFETNKRQTKDLRERTNGQFQAEKKLKMIRETLIDTSVPPFARVEAALEIVGLA